MSESSPSGSAAVSDRRIFAILVGLAVAFRIVSIALYPEHHFSDPEFQTIARNLLAGNGFSQAYTAPFEPTMYREPLYPWFLAFAFALPGDDATTVRALQVVLTALASGLVFLLAMEMGLRRRVAVLAGLFAALHPGLALYSGHVISESVASFTVALALWLFARAWRSRRLLDFAVAGVASGLMPLIKTVFLPLPLCLAIAYLALGFVAARRHRVGAGEWVRDTAPPSITGAALFVLAAVCTVAPWSVRNKVQLGSAALTVRAGMVLWARAQSLTRDENAITTDMYRYWKSLRAQGLSEPEADSRLTGEALTVIGAAPFQYLQGHPRQVGRLWVCSRDSHMLGYEEQTCSNFKTCATQVIRSMAVPLFLAQAALILLGAALLLRAASPAAILVVTVAYLTVMQSFFLYNACRYAIPVLPATVVLLAEGASVVWLLLSRFGAKLRASPAA